ncbi:hypothetical protein HCN44_008581 [Aphidius gifuensis]|uniref:Lipocalin/cytosolic fatty-acid binding domain-containing protein n=1 Tax=Aphidius gifuensis TaxID=684658 RepID=A0A834XN88_APHGI|nr:apolipoprotein D-like [Aphidius gifuensis]KAF7989907.1 hypothetical protein HCN44_008581 [Aphidius gifuensis]
MFYSIFLLSIIFGSSLGQLVIPKFPQQTSISNFDAAKYLGDWYEVLRMPNNYDKDDKCSIINISPSSASIIGMNPVTGIYRRITAGGKQRGNSSVFDFEYPIDEPVDFGVMTISVINYERFAVKTIIEPHKNFVFKEYVWILSRTTTLSREDYECAMNVLKNDGFPVDKLVHVDQCDCPRREYNY